MEMQWIITDVFELVSNMPDLGAMLLFSTGFEWKMMAVAASGRRRKLRSRPSVVQLHFGNTVAKAECASKIETDVSSTTRLKLKNSV